MQDVTLEFDGKEYTVKADNCWGLIEAIEEVVTLTYLAPRLDAGQVPMAKVFRAYVEALSYAGCKGVTVDSIRQGVEYKRSIEMAYELAGILYLASPSMEVKIDGAKEHNPSKKKAPKKPRASASKRG